MNDHFLFLGTGASLGVPLVACNCKVCHSNAKEDKRLRTSGLLTLNQKKILIDCGPDFRQQALTHQISEIDGLLITHAHHDHTASIDELRVFSVHSRKPIPILLSKDTAEDLLIRFKYLFFKTDQKNFTETVSLNILPNERGVVTFEGVEFRYFTYQQSTMKVNGFRVNDFAYLTDIRDYPESIFEELDGVKTLVLSALRFTSSKLHLTVDEAIEFSKKVNPNSTWLTHISHDLSYEKTNAYLPENIRLAYDGLTIKI